MLFVLSLLRRLLLLREVLPAPGLVHRDLLHCPTVAGVVVTRTAAAVAAVRHPPHADHAGAAAAPAAAVGGDSVAELDHWPRRRSRAAQDGLGRRRRRRAASGRRCAGTRSRTFPSYFITVTNEKRIVAPVGLRRHKLAHLRLPLVDIELGVPQRLLAHIQFVDDTIQLNLRNWHLK